MANEIKNWYPPPPSGFPPPPPEDDVLFVEIKSSPTWLSTGRQKLTFTGTVWMLLPFVFLFWKRLSFSLKEFMVWVIAWGGSTGSVAVMLKGLNCSGWVVIGVLYAVAYLHCLMFTSAVYHSRLSGARYRRLLHVLCPQTLLFALSAASCLLVQHCAHLPVH